MQTRKLGEGGLRVSALESGCMGMAECYGQRDEADSIATLDLGVTLVDTIEAYGPSTR